MLPLIEGLHHVTSLAADAQENNDFFTRFLGLRRVKKTVNFDAPETYHLYYGNEIGSPGTIMTYFPFPHIVKGHRGSGEVSEVSFAVPQGSLAFWAERFGDHAVAGVQEQERFGEKRLCFLGPDGECFALTEAAGDRRAPFPGGPVPVDAGLYGFHGVTLRLRDGGATDELLRFMGYELVERSSAVTRYTIGAGNGASFVDLEVLPDAAPARQGAGSVHHVAFAVADRAAQLEVREALTGIGCDVTPVIDRDYFWSIYFRTPGGVLFEVATNEPGFDRDENPAHLGEALKIPAQHAHLRHRIEQSLAPISD